MRFSYLFTHLVVIAKQNVGRWELTRVVHQCCYAMLHLLSWRMWIFTWTRQFYFYFVVTVADYYPQNVFLINNSNWIKVQSEYKVSSTCLIEIFFYRFCFCFKWVIDFFHLHKLKIMRNFIHLLGTRQYFALN